MRITFLLPPLAVAGGVRVVGVHARELTRLGHDIVVVLARARRASIRSTVHSLLSERAWPRRKTVEVPFFYDVDLRIAGKAEIMAGHALPNADVLVATWWETVEWANGLPASKGMKVHFVQDHEVFPYLPVTRIKAAYRLPMPKIAVSQWLYDLLHTEYGAKNVALVPNAVDSTFFNAPARTKQPVPTFGFLYSRSPRKGIAVCIDAIDEVKRKLPSLRVISFGADVFHHTVPLPDWVEFHKNPRQADLPSLYASCDAWLFPSISEGFGLPVLEAMACRTPVIGTSAGVGAEYINNATGALVAPTVGDFVEQMLTFAGMGETEWEARSSAARRRVASYRWKEATALFESFLKSVCADRTT